MRIDNTSIAIMPDYNIATSIVLETVIAILYVIGLYLNIKILIVSRKEKSMTWRIDFAHSIILIFLYTYNPLIHSIPYFVQDLYLVTGTWFCYAAKVVSHFLISYLASHSLIIAFLKYIVIVYGEKFGSFKEKIIKVFFYINVAYPIFLTLLPLIYIPDFFVIYNGHTHINLCLGNDNRTYTKLWSMCELIGPLEDNSGYNAINILKWVVCKAHVILFYVGGCNLLDIFFYCKTFAYMRR